MFYSSFFHNTSVNVTEELLKLVHMAKVIINESDTFYRPQCVCVYL